MSYGRPPFLKQDQLRTADFPPSVGLRNADASEFPEGLTSLAGNVSASVNASVNADSILSDVFSPSEGGLSVRSESRILDGHFDTMPIVPGVVSKRLFAAFLGNDLYSSTLLPNGRKLAWKTEFAAPVTKDSRLEFRLAEGEYELSDGKKAFATFSFGELDEETRKPHNF